MHDVIESINKMEVFLEEPRRRQIVSVLAKEGMKSLEQLRKILRITPSELAGHLLLLQTASYVQIDKGSLLRTTYSITGYGRKKLIAFAAACEEVANKIRLILHET